MMFSKHLFQDAIGSFEKFAVFSLNKSDQEKAPFATFILSEEGSEAATHIVAIPVRDLSELSSGKLFTVFSIN
jgi:hypothetical protein